MPDTHPNEARRLGESIKLEYLMAIPSSFRTDFAAKIAALVALAEQAPPSPAKVEPAEGLVSVPKEPTRAMLQAGSAAADGFGTPLTRTANAYRAMLAAAPHAGENK
jgi:hypothetical protein